MSLVGPLGASRHLRNWTTRFARWSIRRRLAAVVLVTALPLTLLLAAAIFEMAQEASKAQRASLLYTARALAAAVDARIDKHITLGRALAASPELLDDDLERVRGRCAPRIHRHQGYLGGGRRPRRSTPAEPGRRANRPAAEAQSRGPYRSAAGLHPEQDRDFRSVSRIAEPETGRDHRISDLERRPPVSSPRPADGRRGLFGTAERRHHSSELACVDHRFRRTDCDAISGR